MAYGELTATSDIIECSSEPTCTSQADIGWMQLMKLYAVEFLIINSDPRNNPKVYINGKLTSKLLWISEGKRKQNTFKFQKWLGFFCLGVGGSPYFFSCFQYLKFPLPSSSLTSKETVKVNTSLSGVGTRLSFTPSDACLEERLNAVEKLYKIRLTWTIGEGKEGKKTVEKRNKVFKNH